MTKFLKLGLFLVLAAATVTTVVFFFKNSNFAVLNPKGTIAAQQTDLFIAATLLMLIIVAPVFILTFAIAWRYREGNTKAKYSPDLAGNRIAEAVWWTVPLIIIVILSGMIWKSSHELDPFKPLLADKEPITIQVVALDWKWLFIYPDQNIATVNYLQFPVGTPVEFKLTSDGPMNSFWIPQLGGQVYAMAGMESSLNLLASETGEFDGQSANLSGEGFAGMRFKTKASSDAEFAQWVEAAKLSSKKLGHAEYVELAEPSKYNPPAYYSSADEDLFRSVISNYLAPGDAHGGSHAH